MISGSAPLLRAIPTLRGDVKKFLLTGGWVTYIPGRTLLCVKRACGKPVRLTTFVAGSPGVDVKAAHLLLHPQIRAVSIYLGGAHSRCWLKPNPVQNNVWHSAWARCFAHAEGSISHSVSQFFGEQHPPSLTNRSRELGGRTARPSKHVAPRPLVEVKHGPLKDSSPKTTQRSSRSSTSMVERRGEHAPATTLIPS